MIKGIKVPFALAGATIGFSEIGKSLDSTALQSAGETTGKFIAPAVSITMGGFALRKIKEFKENIPGQKKLKL